MAYNNPNQQNQNYLSPRDKSPFQNIKFEPKSSNLPKTPHQTPPTETPHQNSTLNCDKPSTPPTPDRKQVKISNIQSTPPTPLQFFQLTTIAINIGYLQPY